MLRITLVTTIADVDPAQAEEEVTVTGGGHADPAQAEEEVTVTGANKYYTQSPIIRNGPIRLGVEFWGKFKK